MNDNSVDLRNLLRRYKKQIIAIAVALTVLATLGVVGAGYVVYKTATFASEKVSSKINEWTPKAGEGLNLPTVPPSGFVEQLVTDVASTWLQQGLASQEALRLERGLACFDALGGPSPTEVVAYVKGTVKDPQFAAKLDNLAERLKKPSTTNGSGACSQWILNSLTAI